ncbi:GIY-YIG nuclease family protein [Flavobacterium sp. CF136]|uniref:GIY-YIG nuclease family protein n=1 Tax=Flavobacterium sp. (strain CF136) TaxID=1144313 RepID=UPI0002716BA8|nr:GIY-YIG nuclease family protein [Flavobacterium sp. CF136]EJL64087.1 putative endonuclease containing a URI domain-containing protein [Flavobacterium sp. CF136]
MKQYQVYILKCSDNSYYTGMTNNIERRLNEHNFGINKECYTFYKRPLELVFCAEFNEVNQAIAFEKQVKGWSRKKKESIINNKWEDLKKFSECLNETTHKNYIQKT